MNKNNITPENCPYCHLDRDDYTVAFGAFWLYPSKHEGWLLHGGKCKPRPINFCPMCSRDLRENHLKENNTQYNATVDCNGQYEAKDKPTEESITGKEPK